MFCCYVRATRQCHIRKDRRAGYTRRYGVRFGVLKLGKPDLWKMSRHLNSPSARIAVAHNLGETEFSIGLVN